MNIYLPENDEFDDDGELIITDNPHIPNEPKVCLSCNETKLCITMPDEYVCCISCCKKKYEHERVLFCIYCDVCGNLIVENDMCKTCEICGKTTGICCGALYYSQATECTCKKCFDYKCIDCEIEEIPRNKQYVFDGYNLLPLCDKCKQSRNNNEESDEESDNESNEYK